MKQKFIDAYMDVAERFSKLSSAKRLQVGAIVVKNERIISIGYNGMPSGWDNDCEYEEVHPYSDIEPGQQLEKTGHLKTKPEVLHAESNAIAKLARSSESGEGAAIFITHAPCMECAKLIYQSGIATVYYKNEYRSTQGIKFLERSNIWTVKV